MSVPESNFVLGDFPRMLPTPKNPTPLQRHVGMVFLTRGAAIGRKHVLRTLPYKGVHRAGCDLSAQRRWRNDRAQAFPRPSVEKGPARNSQSVKLIKTVLPHIYRRIAEPGYSRPDSKTAARMAVSTANRLRPENTSASASLPSGRSALPAPEAMAPHTPKWPWSLARYARQIADQTRQSQAKILPHYGSSFLTPQIRLLRDMSY